MRAEIEAWKDERAMRRRSLVSTVAVACAVTTIVALAGAGSSPIASKGKRRKLAHKLDPLAALVAATNASSASAGVASPTAVPVPSASVIPAVAVTAPPLPEIKLTIKAGTRVLVFGDSMVDAGFAQRLAKLVAEKGGTVVHDSWTSSTTSTWSKGERLDNLLVVHRPDVVIVALGANEVFLPSPEAVAPRVRHIVQKLAPRPCVWVSPPLWKGETGIVGVERANASPCGFYDSGLVKVERAKDGIHPTPKGGSDWADAVFTAVITP